MAILSLCEYKERRHERTLDIDAPSFRIEVEGRQSALLAEPLGLVDKLVPAIVSSAGIPLGVLVCGPSVRIRSDLRRDGPLRETPGTPTLHNTAQGV